MAWLKKRGNTWFACWLDVGCPAELVRHIVGHDDAEIERRHYYRPTDETQQNYIKKIGELLGL